jgi:hypothetical protein
VKTVQELLRHATSAVTMNVDAQGVTELKRKAHHRIVRMVMGGSLRKRRKPVNGRKRTHIFESGFL